MRLLYLRTILVATDLEPSSDVALESACALARVAGAALTVVHAAPASAEPDETGLPEDVEQALRRAGVKRDEVAVERVRGIPFNAIQAVADRLAADVIVMGPHRQRGSGGERDALGSTAYGVVASAAVPCLVLAEPMHLPLRRVLVPIDLSDTARGALMVSQTWASALRSRESAQLTVLHVESEARASADEAADRIENELEVLRKTGGTWAGVTVHAVTAAGRDVAETIADHASDHDLVVLGTRGLGAEAGGGLGSVASALIRRIRVPLLLVPPAVWRAYTAGQQFPAEA